mmetsp:Transcript_19910/g.41387  ORF Transcript_19910/g.41387 Transcript_19910/m.41387 type:complete len:253 (-) Transcript_19910:133-891(-)
MACSSSSMLRVPPPSLSIQEQTRVHSSMLISSLRFTRLSRFMRSSGVMVWFATAAASAALGLTSGAFLGLSSPPPPPADFRLPFLPNLLLPPAFFKLTKSLILSCLSLMTPPILSMTAVTPSSLAFSIFSKNSFLMFSCFSSSAFIAAFFSSSRCTANLLTSEAAVSISRPPLSSLLSITPSPVLSISLKTCPRVLPFSRIMSWMLLMILAVPESSNTLSWSLSLFSSASLASSSFFFSAAASAFLFTMACS